MTGIQYSDLADRLTPEADQLFGEMAVAHIEAGRGDRLFIRSDSLAGTGLLFRAGNISRSWSNFDGGAIDDLVAYGLLHVAYSRRGTPNYRLSGEGLRFYQWLMEQKGTPVSHVEEVVRSMVNGPEFARDHPSTTHHLSEAFALLWTDKTDNQVVAEMGEHLRGAIMDLVDDVADDEDPPEKPIDRLEDLLRSRVDKLGEREIAVLQALVKLVEVALQLDQRLTHVRDESAKDRPLRSWDEARRAVFSTAFACYEIYRALGKGARA